MILCATGGIRGNSRGTRTVGEPPPNAACPSSITGKLDPLVLPAVLSAATPIPLVASEVTAIAIAPFAPPSITD